MKINFILPGAGFRPVGGFKVVYEYANRLYEMGYEVSIIHPAISNYRDFSIKNFLRIGRYFQRLIDKSYIVKWFDINKGVKLYWVPSLNERFIPDADFVFATAWQTANWVAEYSESKGKKLYLIQHLETWSGSEEEVVKTWKLPLKKIVIAKWLADFGTSIGEEVVLIQNGLDFDKFSLEKPVEDRKAGNLLLMYHFQDWKGFEDAIEAIKILINNGVKVHVECFGAYYPKKELPEWVEYHYQPSPDVLNELYNRAAIFIAPSWSEGWGLPASEAMFCGCALAATDIGGHREFMKHLENAYLSRPKNPVELSRNIEILINNSEERIRIASNGHFSIKEFTWEIAVEKLNMLLESIYEN